MGDYWQRLVATEVTLEDAAEIAARLKAHLVANDVIEDKPDSHNDQLNIDWYRDRPGAEKRVANPRDPERANSHRAEGACMGNGLGIGLNWQFAHPYQGSMHLNCPDCGVENDLVKAWNVLQSCHDKRPPTDPRCDSCSYVGSLNDWDTEPLFAIGHVAVHL